MIETPKQPHDYSIVCNEVAQKDDLSARAKGIYYYLATLPHDWQLNQKELLQHFTEGRTSLKTAFRELKEAGYIVQSYIIDKNGKMNGQKYKVYWASQKKGHNPVLPENRLSGNRPVEKPSVGKPASTKYLNNKVLNNKINKTHKNESDDLFKKLWKQYGCHGNKIVALKYWKQLSQKDRDAIATKVPQYISATPEKQYRKHFQGWINPANRHWETEIVNRNDFQPNNTQTDFNSLKQF